MRCCPWTIAIVFLLDSLLGNLVLKADRVVSSELEQEERAAASCTTSLLQTSIKVQHRSKPAHPHHNMSRSPSGTWVLDLYNACSSSAYSYSMFPQSEIVSHPPSMTRFLHIFKNAGTAFKDSIQGGLPYLGQVGRVYLPFNANGMILNQLMDDPAWFRAIITRDPLTRSLSGFHEATKRLVCSYPIGKCHGGPPTCVNCTSYQTNTSEWIAMFKQHLSMPQQSLVENEYRHMLPQMSYLTKEDGSKVTLDYIGSMNKTDDEFRFIFATQALPKHEHGGMGTPDTNRFRILPEQLPDDVVVQTCHYYRDDYCCLGYEFPSLCKAAGLSCAPSAALK